MRISYHGCMLYLLHFSMHFFSFHVLLRASLENNLITVANHVETSRITLKVSQGLHIHDSSFRSSQAVMANCYDV